MNFMFFNIEVLLHRVTRFYSCVVSCYIIGASLSEPHSSEDNAEVVCLSVMDRHGPRFDVFSFDDSYL